MSQNVPYEVYVIASKRADGSLPNEAKIHDGRLFYTEEDAKEELENSFPPALRDSFAVYVAHVSIMSLFTPGTVSLTKEDMGIVGEVSTPTDEITGDFEVDFINKHVSNPSTNPADYYFQVCNSQALGDHFLITPKEWFDYAGCPYAEDDAVPQSLLPTGFDELQESTYDYNGNPQTGRTDLLNKGFVEKTMV